MIEEGVFLPLSQENQALLWERVVADGFPLSSAGLSSWVQKQVGAKAGGRLPPMLQAGKDYIERNPQVVQQLANIAGEFLKRKRV